MSNPITVDTCVRFASNDGDGPIVQGVVTARAPQELAFCLMWSILNQETEEIEIVSDGNIVEIIPS